MARQRHSFTLSAFRAAVRGLVLFVLLLGFTIPFSPAAVPVVRAEPSAPVITSLSVTQAANDFDTSITINGSYFWYPVTVKLGTIDLAYPNVNPEGTQIKVTVPWGITPGDYQLIVTSKDGDSLPQPFKVIPGLNTLTSEGPYGGGVLAMEIYPFDGNVILADMGTSGLYRTMDGGENWEQIFKPADTWASLEMDMTNPDRVYIARYKDGLYRTEEASYPKQDAVVPGQISWTKMNLPLPAGTLPGHIRPYVHPLMPGVVFAGIYENVDSCNVGGIACGLFKSANFGQTWSKVTAPTLTDDAVTSMAFHPTDQNTYYVVTNTARVFKTTDDGATWHDLGTVLKYQEPFQLIVNPFQPDQIWAYGKFGVEQDGKTYHLAVYTPGENGALGAWAYQDYSLPNGEQICEIVYDIRQTTPRLMAVTSGGIFSSETGTSFTLLSDKIKGPCGSIVLPNKSNPYPGYQNTFFTSYNARGVYKTSDDGQSFTNKSRGLTGFGITDLRVSPHDPSTVYAIAQDVALFKTTNGGANWHELPVNVWPGAISPITLDPTTDGRLYLGSFFSYFTAVNGGETKSDWQMPSFNWNDVNAHPDLMPAEFSTCMLRESASFAVAKGIGAGGKDRLFMGVSFRNFSSGNCNESQVPGMVIFASDDQGAHWTQALKKFNGFFPSYLLVDPADPKRIIVGANSDPDNNKYGVTGIFYSLDGGATWHDSGMDLSAGRSLGYIVNGKDHTLLTSFGSVFAYSTDYGKNWQGFVDVGAEITKIVYGPAVFGLYIGTTGGVRVSYDDGKTWQPIPGTLGQVIISGLDIRQVGNRTFLYASTPGGSMGGAAQAPALNGLNPAAADELAGGIYRYTLAQSMLYMPGVMRNLPSTQ